MELSYWEVLNAINEKLQRDGDFDQIEGVCEVIGLNIKYDKDGVFTQE